MIGQGRPRISRFFLPNHVAATIYSYGGKFVAVASWAVFLFVCSNSLMLCDRAAADDSLRVRIAWGGNQGHTWDGTISISNGRLDKLCPLGIEADEPGSMWLDDGRLLIRQKTPRLYDGLDVDVRPYSHDAVLRIALRAADQDQASQLEIPLADLKEMVGERTYNTSIDEQGTRLLVRRRPGDTLRVKFDRRSLVFVPGEKFKFSVLPHEIPDLKGQRLRIKVDVYADRGERRVSGISADIEPIASGPSLAMNVNLPDEEGVYDLVVSAEQVPSVQLPRGVSLPVGWKKTVAQRKLQVVVLSKEKTRLPAGDDVDFDSVDDPDSSANTAGQQSILPGFLASDRSIDNAGPRKLTTVAEIDPANPKWLERLFKSAEDIRLFNKLPALQAFGKGPISSGHLSIRQHPLGALAELAPGRPGRESWEAYTLPIRNAGKPHVLEVEYPSDFSQTMGISVLEPNAAGEIQPIQLDSGVDVVDEMIDDEATKPRMLRHRVIFWPRGNSPIVLITNRRYDSPAVYGRIRVLGGWEHLPQLATEGNESEAKAENRMTAVYMDRPLFPESFSASESYDAWSRRSLEDWHTFHEGATRMVEYMRYVGMDGLMLSVLADGATIYPSRILQPTPRYDKGVFFDSGQDPVQKDVVEMLLRIFDREQLRLIPALEFGSPLPELEALLRRGGDECVGIRWMGPEGQAWQDVYEPHRQRAAYYNVLNPRVQEAMLKVVGELLDSYSGHESLAGLAIQLSGHGYAQLPGPDWGMDDVTVAEFQRDTGISLTNATVKADENRRDRCVNRWKQLTGPYRNQWLRWRAKRLAAFYHRMQAQIAKAQPGAKLYLAGADAFDSREMQALVRPSLPRRISMAEMFLSIGIDESHYRNFPDIVLLRPQCTAPCRSYISDAAQLEIEQMPDRDAYFAELPFSGNLFFNQPRELRLKSFDSKSPFRSSFTLLSSQIVPSGARNSRHFVHALSELDSQVVFEGGWLVPLGQEDTMRPLLAAYRRLPAVAFESLSGGDEGNEGTHPVTVRYATHKGRTFLYAANDSPLQATLDVRFKLTANRTFAIKELSGLREVSGLKHDERGAYWRVKLEPYDFMAVRLSRDDVLPAEARVAIDENAENVLRNHIRDLGTRANALRAPPELKALDNADFERPTDVEGKIPGWTAFAQDGSAVEFERTQLDSPVYKPRGIHCLRLRSNGARASLVSDTFKPPQTGRLKMLVWLCVPKAAKQPKLQLSLVGKLDGREFSRLAVVGQSTANSIGDEWGLYEFPVNNLPLEGLEELRVRFDLLAPGEVLIDDVQLKHLEFEERELRELVRLIQTADLQLRMNQVGDCVQLLEGYWPRFLEANVSLPAAAIQPAVAAKPHAAPKPRGEKDEEIRSGWLDRVKGILPKKLW